jgi:hypothetical protein
VAREAKKAPHGAGLAEAWHALIQQGAARSLVATLFPMVMDAHLVANGVMMLVRLSRSDCAQGSHGCSKGEDDLLHYRILKSVLGASS